MLILEKIIFFLLGVQISLDFIISSTLSPRKQQWWDVAQHAEREADGSRTITSLRESLGIGSDFDHSMF